MHPFRVLQVINSLDVAGAEVLVTQLARGLRKKGMTADVAVLGAAESRLAADLQESGCRVLATGPSRLRSPGHIPVLRRIFRDYDLVHSHLYPAQLWTVLAARGRRYPLVTTEHGSDNNRRHSLAIFRYADQCMYRAYDLIICNSDATRAALEAWVPAAAERMSVIPNGIDYDEFATAQPCPRTSFVQRAGPLALFVARLEPQKDHATLLRALAKIPTLNMAFVGEGHLRSALESLATDLGVSERVFFVGRRDDVPALLKSADIYVHSCPFDGFGLAALEAMAAGLPVVAADVPGLRDVIGDGGMLVKSGDPVAFADAIQSLLASANLRAEIAEKGRRRATQFSIETTVAAYIAVYESLLGSTARLHASCAS